MLKVHKLGLDLSFGPNFFGLNFSFCCRLWLGFLPTSFFPKPKLMSVLCQDWDKSGLSRQLENIGLGATQSALATCHLHNGVDALGSLFSRVVWRGVRWPERPQRLPQRVLLNLRLRDGDHEPLAGNCDWRRARSESLQGNLDWRDHLSFEICF